MTIICKVINLKTETQVIYKMVHAPRIGDKFPINYLNEKVKEVFIVTPLLVDHLKITGTFDLLVYTE